jgi:hypothetical protein
VLKEFAPFLAQGYDIRPTIAGTLRAVSDVAGLVAHGLRRLCAVTKAHIELPELMQGVQSGRVKPDGVVLMKSGQANVTKVGACFSACATLSE